MKKTFILMAIAIFVVNFASAQIKSIDSLTVTSMVNSAKIAYKYVTTKTTDTTWLKHEVATNPLFTGITFFTPKVRKIGTGVNVESLVPPLVNAGDTAYVRVIASNDSLFAVMLKSTTRIIVPKFQPILPNVVLVNQTLTTDGGLFTLNGNIGKADSSVMQIIVSPDSLFQYIFTKKYVLKKDGIVIDTLSGLNDGQKYYVKCIITNSIGSKTITWSFITLQKNHKPWLGAINTTPVITSTSIEKIAGQVMGYGSATDVWLTYNGKKCSAVNLSGVGTQTYSIDLTSLTPSTVYAVKGFAKNLYGIDSLILGTFKTSAAAVKFYAHATSAIGSTNSGIGTGTYAQSVGSVATLTGAVYPGSDPQCTGASLQSVTNDYTSTSGSVSINFNNLNPGTYWFKFYGTCSPTGEFDLDSPPVSFTVAATGIWEVEKEIISIYPNPTVDLLKFSAPFKDDCHVEIRNMIGQIVISNDLNDGEKEINVSELPEGSYILTIKTKYDGFKIARFIKGKA